MQRIVNMVIGLTVVTGVAVLLFGSIGSKGGGWNSRSGKSTPGIEGLETAGQHMTPVATQPPPFPSVAPFPPVPAPPALAVLLANPADPPAELIEARWQIVRRRVDSVFGFSLPTEKRDAIDTALGVWIRAQLTNLAAYHGGYIDKPRLGMHAAWARSQYVMTLQAVLGVADYERYSDGIALAEVKPTFP